MMFETFKRVCRVARRGMFPLQLSILLLLLLPLLLWWWWWLWRVSETSEVQLRSDRWAGLGS
jgi:hypothetical protein